jgi:hypothetical protein
VVRMRPSLDDPQRNPSRPKPTLTRDRAAAARSVAVVPAGGPSRQTGRPTDLSVSGPRQAARRPRALACRLSPRCAPGPSCSGQQGAGRRGLATDRYESRPAGVPFRKGALCQCMSIRQFGSGSAVARPSNARRMVSTSSRSRDCIHAKSCGWLLSNASSSANRARSSR